MARVPLERRNETPLVCHKAGRAAPALFNVAIDSKLRGCDLVKLGVSDLVKDDRVRERVSVAQSKTKRPIQFELAENTRETVLA